MLRRLPSKVGRQVVAFLSTAEPPVANETKAVTPAPKKKRVVFDPHRFRQPGDVPKEPTEFPYVYPDPEEAYYKRRFYPKLKGDPEDDEKEHGLGGWRKRGDKENYGRSFRESRRTRDEFIARQDLALA